MPCHHNSLSGPRCSNLGSPVHIPQSLPFCPSGPKAKLRSHLDFTRTPDTSKVQTTNLTQSLVPHHGQPPAAALKDGAFCLRRPSPVPGTVVCNHKYAITCALEGHPVKQRDLHMTTHMHTRHTQTQLALPAAPEEGWGLLRGSCGVTPSLRASGWGT